MTQVPLGLQARTTWFHSICALYMYEYIGYVEVCRGVSFTCSIGTKSTHEYACIFSDLTSGGFVVAAVVFVVVVVVVVVVVFTILRTW